MRSGLFRNRSLVWSITLGYLLITAIPFAATYLFTTSYWWSASKEESRAYSQSLLQFTKEAFDTQLQQMEKLSGLLYSKQDLIADLGMDPRELSELRSIEINNALDKLFYDITYTRSDVVSMYVFEMDGQLRYHNGNPSSFYKHSVLHVQHEEWFEHSKLAGGKTILISKPLSFHDSSKPVLSIARLIKQSSKPVGVIMLDFSFEVLQDIINQSSTAERRIVVSNFDGDIITQSRKEEAPHSQLAHIPYEVRSYIAANLSGSATIEVEGSPYLVIYDTLERYSIKLTHLIPIESLTSQNLNYMLRLNTYMSIVMVVLILASIAYFRKRVAPLHRLARIMPRSILEPFNQRFTVHSTDEVGLLSAAFNQMMERLQQLFQLEFKHRLEKSETEKALLEAQINPHFLYNTLDTIRFKAIEQGNVEVGEMLYALSTNLRYTIENTSNKVSVREEVEWLKRYIYLQKLRFGKRFEVFFQIDVSIYDMSIYRLILQPFIENAILHGFQRTKQGGILNINGYWDKSEQKLVFEIVDNGCGFAYELDEYVDEATLHRLTRDRIGMYNALKRLFLYYGSQCRAYIHSIPGKRTAIKLTIDIDEVISDARTVDR